MLSDSATPENSESSVPATAAPRGRGLEALYTPVDLFPQREAGIVMQALAMQQLERIERADEEDDVRCNVCLVTWVRNGVPRPHLESCMVGRALHLAELAFDGWPTLQAPMVAAPRFSQVELTVWARPDAPTDEIHVPGDPVLDHHGRADFIEVASAFPKTRVTGDE